MSSPEADRRAAIYLEEVRGWHSALVEFMGGSAPGAQTEWKDLSERAKRALATWLATDWSDPMAQWAARSPYNLHPFPAASLKTEILQPMDAVLELLRWRAAVIDCLSDIWDVMGEPLLEIHECAAILHFLKPAGERKLCHLCLTEFQPEQLNPDQHGCLMLGHVQSKWPVSSFELPQA